jgi:hypothetical protein
MFGAPLGHLAMFEKLCGNDHFRNVILVTTIWDQVDAQVGLLRRTELERKYWGSMIKNGSRIPFHNTKESAWEIIRQVVGSKSGLDSDPQSPIPSPLLDKSRSVLYDEKLSRNNTRTSSSSRMYDTALSETITVLRFAADLELVPGLKGTIAMALEVAELIAVRVTHIQIQPT